MTDVVEVARSDWVVVVAPGITETIEVPSATLDLVEVAEQGPAGPPGADGADGSPGAQGPQGAQGEPGPNTLHIGPDQPDFGELPGLWIQTGLGAGGDMTFWVEDGA